MQSITDAPRAPLSHLNLPFFEAQHRSLAEQLRDWVPQQRVDESDDRAAC
ncbi:MAG: acyl-CoA dehydrogenase, partial [Rhodoferax sp.]|nr:acyl-CoA dehydrogenase [Rhodoferax sp.]